MFGICDKGALSTLTNQANYHRLDRVLDSPPLDSNAKYQSLGLARGCNRAKVKVRYGIDLGRVELIVQ